MYLSHCVHGIIYLYNSRVHNDVIFITKGIMLHFCESNLVGASIYGFQSVLCGYTGQLPSYFVTTTTYIVVTIVATFNPSHHDAIVHTRET